MLKNINATSLIYKKTIVKLMIHKNKKFNQIDIMKILKVKMKSKSKKSLLK